MPADHSPAHAIDLRGKTALVTGASRGIGLASAAALADAGAGIVALSRNSSKSTELVTIADRAGVELHCVDTSLRERAGVRRAVDEVHSRVGVPDVIVHAAGVNRRAPAAEFPDEFWDEIIAVNLTAPFILTRDLGRGMVERGSGKVIFVASMMSFQGGLMVPAYAASKGGIAQVTKSFANEWAASGVNVNAVAPGYVATAMTEDLQTDATRNRQISERIPAGRWATPADVAKAVLFLASDLAEYVHGALIPVDGGWLAR